MNGQKIIQNDSTGERKTEKISKCKDVKAGIYNLYNAVYADKKKDNIGEVIHVDKKENVLYQKHESQYIKHDLNCFDQIPETGCTLSIKYLNDKATTTETSIKLEQKNKL